MTNVTSGDPEQGCRFAISGVVPVTVSRFVISLYSCRAVIALRWLARRLAGLWVERARCLSVACKAAVAVS